MTRLRVGIFAGGRSAEHEVSISSADSVLRAIDRERFEPFLVYIDRDGRWHLPAGPAPVLDQRPLAELLGAATPAEQTSRLRAHADLPVAVDEFAEAVVQGKDVARLMPLVQQHLDLCPDCREEFEALLRVLRANQPGG